MAEEINRSSPDRKPEFVKSSPEFRPPILFLKLLRILPFPAFSAGGSSGLGIPLDPGLLGGSAGGVAWDSTGVETAWVLAGAFGGAFSMNAPGGRV